jgi:hypothetical protein
VNPTPPPSSATALIELAQRLLDEGRHGDVLTICDYLQARGEANLTVAHLSFRALLVTGAIEAALERFDALRTHAQQEGSSVVDINKASNEILLAAATHHQELINAGQLEAALRLSETLVRLFPRVKLFIESALSLSRVVGDQERVLHYGSLRDELLREEHRQLAATARAHHSANRLEDELAARIATWHHPLDQLQPSGLRHDNLFMALCCLFAGPKDEARLEQARAIVRAVPPPLAPANDPLKTDAIGRFDQFYRLLFRVINIDAIYKAPDFSPIRANFSFANSAGTLLTLAQLQEHARAIKARVAFFTAGSELYFNRCAKSYIRSVLRNADVNCLVFVCASGAWDQPDAIARKLGIDDERLIICADDFVDTPGRYRVYNSTDIKPTDEYPISIPINYYPSVGLVNLDLFLHQLGLPVFLSGMDTVLQRGVATLLDEFADCDLVVNNLKGSSNIASKLINSLQLVLPTANAKLFADFMGYHFRRALQEVQQPFAMDQLFLYMATEHLLANGREPKVGHFGEFDINNCMFNNENITSHREFFDKFRFINIFNMGQGDKALLGEDIVS